MLSDWTITADPVKKSKLAKGSTTSDCSKVCKTTLNFHMNYKTLICSCFNKPIKNMDIVYNEDASEMSSIDDCSQLNLF